MVVAPNQWVLLLLPPRLIENTYVHDANAFQNTHLPQNSVSVPAMVDDLDSTINTRLNTRVGNVP